MSQLRLSEFAHERIQLLPRDPVLLMAIWRHLEWAAQDPESRTQSPPPFPHRQDRRFLHFIAADSNRNEWTFSALFDLRDDTLCVTFLDFLAPESVMEPE